MTRPLRDHLRATLPGPVVPLVRQTDGAIRLPIPPSVNNLFANAKGRGRVKSAEYRSWLQSASLIMRVNRYGLVPSPVCVTIRVGKCNVLRDLDNLGKPCLDVLVADGVIADDSVNHVHEVRFIRAFETVAAGWVEIDVRPAETREVQP